jgi:threonine dehydrogenase-like Zn-dependent dehydrogenase
LAIMSAWLLGASRVIAIDQVPERLQMAREKGKAEVIDLTREDVFDRLQDDDRWPGS